MRPVAAPTPPAGSCWAAPETGGPQFSTGARVLGPQGASGYLVPQLLQPGVLQAVLLGPVVEGVAAERPGVLPAVQAVLGQDDWERERGWRSGGARVAGQGRPPACGPLLLPPWVSRHSGPSGTNEPQGHTLPREDSGPGPRPAAGVPLGPPSEQTRLGRELCRWGRAQAHLTDVPNQTSQPVSSGGGRDRAQGGGWRWGPSRDQPAPCWTKVF